METSIDKLIVNQRLTEERRITECLYS